MQLVEILSSHLSSGAVVLDLTSARAELVSPAAFPPHTGVSVRRAIDGGARPETAVVLQHVPTTAVEGAAPGAISLEAADLAARVVHGVFLDRLSTLVERGLLDLATRGGWELEGIHGTSHAVFPYLAVLVPAQLDDGAATQSRLRVVNEYRYQREVVREQERELARLAVRTDELQRQARTAQRRVAELEAEVAALQGRVPASGSLAERAERAERQLAETRRRLEKARGSVGFRVGRATRVALREGAKNPLAIPALWLRSFREAEQRGAARGR